MPASFNKKNAGLSKMTFNLFKMIGWEGEVTEVSDNDIEVYTHDGMKIIEEESSGTYLCSSGDGANSASQFRNPNVDLNSDWGRRKDHEREFRTNRRP